MTAHETEVDATFHRLELSLAALIELVEKHRVSYWPETLKTYARGIKDRAPATLVTFAAHNRSGFGGLLDLCISPGNGHAIAEEEAPIVDRRLTTLRSEVIRDVAQLEHLAYRIRDADGVFLCPVCGCGGDLQENSFGLRGGRICTSICRCCHYEPGFDDDPAASAQALPTVAMSIDAYRRAWVDAGKPWRGRLPAPTEFNADHQLARLLAAAPYLR
jgi:hypothetical protein